MAPTTRSTSSPSAGNAFVYYPISAETGEWGTPVIVDADGNPLPSPPPYTIHTDPETGKPTVALVAGESGVWTDLATGAPQGAVTPLFDPATGQPATLPAYKSPGTPAPLESPPGEEDEILPGDLPEGEEPGAGETGTAETGEEAQAREGGAGGITEEIPGAGLTDEELESLTSSLPRPAEAAGSIGPGVEELAAIPEPTFELEPASGQVAFGDGPTGQVPDAGSLDPVTGYRTAGETVEPTGRAATPGEPIEAIPITGVEVGEVEPVALDKVELVDPSEPAEFTTEILKIDSFTDEATRGSIAESAVPVEEAGEDEELER